MMNDGILVESETSELEIVYQDEFCIAINKPPGLMVHWSREEPRLQDNVISRLRRQLGRLVYPVHRLDRGTSGVLLFALDAELLKKLMNDFAERHVDKEYTTVVRGWTDDSGVIDSPLVPWYQKKSRKPSASKSEPQHAVTRYETLSRGTVPLSAGKYPTSRYSLVRIHPETGRTHQIRRHMKRISHPVIGDRTHGDHRHNLLFREKLSIDRMLLAATRLRFEHPVSGEQVSVHASPGDEFESAVRHIDFGVDVE